MKTVFLWVLACCLSFSGNSQGLFDGYKMGTLGAGYGSHFIVQGSFDVLPTSNMYYSIGLGLSLKETKNPPPDDDLLDLFEWFDPLDETWLLNISIGRVFELGSDRARLVLCGGPGIGFFVPAESNFKESNVVYALNINPRLDFPLARGFGLSLSPVCSLNNKELIYGFLLNMHFGYLRD